MVGMFRKSYVSMTLQLSDRLSYFITATTRPKAGTRLIQPVRYDINSVMSDTYGVSNAPEHKFSLDSTNTLTQEFLKIKNFRRRIAIFLAKNNKKGGFPHLIAALNDISI